MTDYSNDFNIENGRLLKYIGKGGDVAIPNGVTVICNEAFHGCKLTSVTIPEGVKIIGRFAFSNSGMQEDTVVLPEGLELIGTMAFFGNIFGTVRIPRSVKHVEHEAFSGTRVIEIYESYRGSVCEIGSDEKKHIISVLSADTDEAIFKVPMFYDGGKDLGLKNLLKSAWREDAPVFDFEKLDNYFKKIKFPETKALFAEFRINNPYSLSDEHRNMYASYLKRTQKSRDTKVEDSAKKHFEIKGNQLVKFIGDDSVTEVVIPNGVKEISWDAFCTRNAINIKRIILPESFTVINLSAFDDLSSTLESISIPNSVSKVSWNYPLQIPNKLIHLKYNECQNGLYLGNEKNPHICLMGIKDRTVSDIEIVGNARFIGPIAFKDLRSVCRITLPDNIIRIEEQFEKTFTESMQMNMPAGYFRTAEPLPAATTLELLQTVWKDQVSFEDCVWIYLFQTGVSYDKFSSKVICKDASRAMDEMLGALEKNPKQPAYKKAAKFACQNKGVISADRLQRLYDNAVKAKVSGAEMDLLKGVTDDAKNAKENPAEAFCREQYDAEEVNAVLKKAKINLAAVIKKKPVHYSADNGIVPAFVLQCVVAKYVELMQGDSPQPKHIKEIDKIAAAFDEKDFESLIAEVGSYTLNHAGENWVISSSGVEAKYRFIGVIGRYGNAEMITWISNVYDTIKAEYDFVSIDGDPLPKINKWKRYLKAAILMSDRSEARKYCISKGWTAEYASIRGMERQEVEELAGMKLTPDDRKVLDAVALYENWVSALNDLVDADGTYNEPTVEEAPSMSPVSSGNPLAKRFYAAIRDRCIEKGQTRFANDLYRRWMDSSCIEDGQIGIEFSVGLLVASYMFVSKEVRGSITYSRSKWEYRGDYSSATRLCLSVSEKASDWKAYMDTGYRVYDM